MSKNEGISAKEVHALAFLIHLVQQGRCPLGCNTHKPAHRCSSWHSFKACPASDPSQPHDVDCSHTMWIAATDPSLFCTIFRTREDLFLVAAWSVICCTVGCATISALCPSASDQKGVTWPKGHETLQRMKQDKCGGQLIYTPLHSSLIGPV